MKLQALKLTRLAIAVIVAASSSTGQTSYSVIDLGALSGVSDSGANAINNRGQAAGFCLLPDNADPWHPCLWEENGEMTDLGRAAWPNNARGINNRGQVVGGSFIWQGGKMTDLGTNSCPECEAAAINDSGQVVGTFYIGGRGRPHAYLWEYGVMTDLGTLSGDPGEYSWALGVNNRGQVVGCSGVSVGRHAFLWEKGKMIDLRIPGEDSCAYAINDRGQVVGAFGYPIGTWPPHAFLWENGRITDLSRGAEFAMIAQSINNRGQVVGSSEFYGGFVWSAGAITDLGSLLPKALAINDRGQIVGGAVRLDPKDLVPWTPDGSALGAGGWVQDDVYGMRAALYVPPDVVPAGTRLDVEIRVFEDPPNLRIPSIYRPGTFFTDIVPIHESGVLLNSTTQGFVVHLPLASPLPAGTVMQLLRPHPFTGKLLPVPGVSGKWIYGTVNSSGSAADFSGIASLSTPVTTFSTFVGLAPAAILGDVNGDGTVDCTDLGLLKDSFGKRSGQLGFNPQADFNDDGIVDLNDLVLVSRQLPAGASCP